MTIAVANTALTNSVDYWRARTNELADAMSTKAVTVDSNTATGNAAITGTFTAGTLVANVLTITAAAFAINSTSITVLNLTANAANLTYISGNTATYTTGTFTNLNGTTGNVTTLSGNAATYGTATVTNATITTLQYTTANGTTLKATTANLVSLSGNAATYTHATITNATVNALIFTNMTMLTPNTTQVSNGSFYFNANGSYVYLPVSVAGSNTQVIFNDEGGYSGSAGFIFNKTSNSIAVANSVLIGNNASMYGYNTTTGATSQVLDSFLLSSFRAAKYLVTVKDRVANNYQISELLLIHDDGVATMTEFGTIACNGALAAFECTTNSTAAILKIIPTSTNTAVNMHKTLMSVMN